MQNVLIFGATGHAVRAKNQYHEVEISSTVCANIDMPWLWPNNIVYCGLFEGIIS
ncbi:MAG: hypothetical protein H7246_01135 [Phycisphaerae bacterium]|nr:hypothetical protein [Saprospiraceae bacterium]